MRDIPTDNSDFNTMVYDVLNHKTGKVKTMDGKALLSFLKDEDFIRSSGDSK
jgi:hypothetical protein